MQPRLKGSNGAELLSPGTMLQGRFRIEGQVGRGGMAVVYSAHDVQFNQRVAVKQLSVRVSGSGEHDALVSQFEHEARILRSLNHENIPRVYGFFEEGGDYFLIMDFVDGQTLGTTVHLKADGTPDKVPTPQEVVEWGLQVARALDYLHNHKPQPIIYKDLKPSNLLLTPSGKVMLVDFGLAKGLDLDGDNPTILKGAGTPGFSPPEQRETTTDLRCDPRVDLYALGATLYTLLTGTVPADATTRSGPGGDTVQKLGALRDGVPKELEDLLHHLMAFKREERLSSAREAVQKLEAIKAKFSVNPLEVSTIPVAGPWQAAAPGQPPSRKVAGAAVGVAAVVLLGALLVPRFTGPSVPTGATPPAVTASGSPGVDVPTPSPTVFKMEKLED